MGSDEASRLESALALLEERLHPAAVVLFGSQAAGRAQPQSDVDLGVLVGGEPPDAFAVAALKTELEARPSNAL